MSTDQVKDTLRMMPYGFYAVTSKSGSDSNAMVANWITQISFEPRRVALALQPTSYTYGLINTTKVLVVNLFNKEDSEYIKPFMSDKDLIKNLIKRDGVIKIIKEKANYHHTLNEYFQNTHPEIMEFVHKYNNIMTIYEN